MRALGFVVLAIVGCAGRYRTESVGVVQLGADRGAVELPAGTYRFALRFDVPRAQRVEWALACPGVDRSGTTGETFEAYRERRLAELRRRTEADRAALAGITNAVVGTVGARAQVSTPGASVARSRGSLGPGTARAEHSPEHPLASVAASAEVAPGEVVAAHAIQPISELAPGDVGAGTYTQAIDARLFEAGTCTVTARGIDPVSGTIGVARIRDLQAEEQARIAAQRARDEERRVAFERDARSVRVRLGAALVASGADADARARRMADKARRDAEEAGRRAVEEATRRAEAERVRAEEDARRAERERIERERRDAEQARLEAERARVAVIRARERAVADANWREAERIRIEAEARAREKAELELRIRMEVTERIRIRARTVRSAVIAYLVGTCGGDPGRRARIATAQQAERDAILEIEIERKRKIEIELRIKREREQRARLERERVAREFEQRQHGEALSVRQQLAAYLMARGARLRPPRPAPIVEIAGAPPFDGARWEAGAWLWLGGEWTWRKGGWTDATRFGATGGEVAVRAPAAEPIPATHVSSPPVAMPTPPAAVVPASEPVVIEVPPVVQGVISVDVVAPPRPARRSPTVRDHRRASPTPPAPPPPSAPRGTVRDHRR